MAIRREANTIHLSVRDLLHTDRHATKTLSSFPLPQRGILGQQAQSNLHKKRDPAYGLFHREWQIRRQITYQGFVFDIRGRIDGLFELPGQIDVEEVKSVILTTRAFKDLDIKTYPEFSEQVLIYSYLLHLENPSIHIQPLLILVNLVDDRVRRFPLTFQSNDVKSLLEQRFAEIIGLVKTEARNYQRRLKKLAGITFTLKEKRPQQEEMMEAVSSSLKSAAHLLISAPTGTGKTAAALYPVIKYAIRNKKKIIYLTPKTTQQAILRDTLEPLVSAGLDLRVSFLRAAQKMCANDIFFCHEDYCPYAKDYVLHTLKSNLQSQLLRQGLIYPEQVFEQARTAGLCPAETQRDLNLAVDMIVGDYNYIFDPAVQLRHIFRQKDQSEWILIIDEAHNLYQRTTDTLSPQIKRREILDLRKNIMNKRLKIFRDLDNVLLKTDQLFGELQQEGELHYSGQQYFTVTIDRTVWKKVLADYEKAFIRYLIFKIRKNLILLNDPFELFYYSLRRFVRLAAFEGNEFVHFYNADQGGILKIQCCDPALHIGGLISGFHSVIAMSATLDPLDYYQEILGFPAGQTRQLTIGSPFSNQNRQILILPHIPTYYKERSRSYPLYAALVKDIISLKEGNYIVFCPSYEFLQTLAVFLGHLSSELILQRPQMDEKDRSTIITSLKTASGPTLLLAVMGGIFAEGIDLQGDSCIGVIVFSPALPAITYERELIRNYFEERRGAGVSYAYLFPGINKVIQSVGRLIRSHEDRGIIVLAGERFAQEEINRFLPSYWFKKNGDLIITEDYITHIRAFWKRFEEQE
jgi:DNA excision repair protein ERCC-2